MKKLFVLIFAALLVMAFTTPAMAKFNIGCVIATDFYYVKSDAQHDVGGVPTVAGVTALPGDDDWSGVKIQVPGWSRPNITWTNEKDVRARIEFGVGDQGAGKQVSGTGGTNGAATLRHAYGEWDVTPNFTLMAGWSTTPFSPMDPTQTLGTHAFDGVAGALGHIIMLGFGNFYSGRFPQVRGTWKFSNKMKFEMALVDPNVTAAGALFPAAPGKAVDNDSTLPRIDLAADLYFGPVKLYPSMFYHKQSYDNVGAGSDNDITSYGYSLGVRFAIGPVNIAAEAQIGENWANTKSTIAGFYDFSARTNALGQVADSDDLGWWIDVSFKLGPCTPHLLYAVRDTENEGFAGTADDWEWKSQAYGIHVVIPVARTFMIRPEFMVYDYDDAAENSAGTGVTVDYGKQTIMGVQFMVVF